MHSQPNQYCHLNQEGITGFSREVTLLVITSKPFSDTLHAELKGLNRYEKKKKKKKRERESESWELFLPRVASLCSRPNVRIKVLAGDLRVRERKHQWHSNVHTMSGGGCNLKWNYPDFLFFFFLSVNQNTSPLAFFRGRIPGTVAMWDTVGLQLGRDTIWKEEHSSWLSTGHGSPGHCTQLRPLSRK